MRGWLGVCLALVSACVEAEVPPPPQAPELDIELEADPPGDDEVDSAVAVAEEYFGENFSDQAIVWVEGPCIVIVGVEGGCRVGVLYRGSIWLVDREGPVWESSLAHELMHEYLRRRGFVDVKHEGPEWALVPELMRLMREAWESGP